MRHHVFIFSLCLASMVLHAEEPAIDFEVISSRTEEVTEAEAGANHTAVAEDTIRMTVELVRKPELSEASAEIPPTSLPEEEEDTAPQTMVFVSATVYADHRTLLRCHINGPGGPEVLVWSSIDFNHLRGVSTFDVSGINGQVRSYALGMGLGNEEAAAPEDQVVPLLPDAAISYAILSENPDPSTSQFVEDLHVYYQAEGERLAMEHAQPSEKVPESPPAQRDVVIRFWNRVASDDGGTNP